MSATRVAAARPARCEGRRELSATRARPASLWRREWKPLLAIAVAFLLLYHFPTNLLPVGGGRPLVALGEGALLAREYARAHVILCLLPAFLIAGGISVFVSQGSVMRYLGADANKAVAYGVAAVSGTMLAVCSCTVLPLFAGIYAMGAGLGPASSFLYAGPAINVLAIVFTAAVLGPTLGLARAVGAIVFAVIIGVLMQAAFRRRRDEPATPAAADEGSGGGVLRGALLMAALVGILVFANWGDSADGSGVWHAIYSARWVITAALAVVVGIMLVVWLELEAWRVAAVGGLAAATALLFGDQPLIPFGVAVVGLAAVAGRDVGSAAGEWMEASWRFAKQILPLLLLGVLVAGVLLGRPGHEGVVPASWVAGSVGGESLPAVLVAAVAGAFMYFATLTEVPILQGLIGAGMGAGPALALLLAGPALSLPNMLVIRSVIGTRKTVVYVALVVVMSTVAGLSYGLLAGTAG